MHDRNARKNDVTGGLLSIACALVFMSLSGTAAAASIPRPSVPPNLEVPAGNKPYFIGHAVGTQNYVCLPVDGAVKFVLITPEATLFDDDVNQVTTHYFSANPYENGMIRATWQHSRDTSIVWGKVNVGDSSTDPNYVRTDAIAWLKITVAGGEDGPTDGDALSSTTFIQRINTTQGKAPAADCASFSQIGNQAFVPYTADYVFYRKQ
jgi:hypothetical protein